MRLGSLPPRVMHDQVRLILGAFARILAHQLLTRSFQVPNASTLASRMLAVTNKRSEAYRGTRTALRLMEVRELGVREFMPTIQSKSITALQLKHLRNSLHQLSNAASVQTFQDVRP